MYCCLGGQNGMEIRLFRGVSATKSRCFCFPNRGAGPSDGAGGGVLTERSKTLGPGSRRRDRVSILSHERRPPWCQPFRRQAQDACVRARAPRQKQGFGRECGLRALGVQLRAQRVVGAPSEGLDIEVSKEPIATVSTVSKTRAISMARAARLISKCGVGNRRPSRLAIS